MEYHATIFLNGGTLLSADVGKSLRCVVGVTSKVDKNMHNITLSVNKTGLKYIFVFACKLYTDPYH